MAEWFDKLSGIINVCWINEKTAKPGLKIDDEDAFDKPDFYLEIRLNGDTVSLAFAHTCAGYVASAETVSRFSEGISEYFEIISNDEKKLKLFYDNSF